MTNVFPFHDVANILLFLFLIYSILAIFFKPDKSRIYCGIFAFCGPTNLSKNIYSMVLANTKILGLYNDDRGGDNAGIMINNNVYRTSGFQRTFKDLIKSVPLENPDPKESTVIIGHCRKGSVGSKEHINAHPFEIFKSDNDADFYMTGVHNGTVSNWEELAEQYHIDPKSMNNDSKTVLTIISRQRNLKKKSPIYKVLEQYEGFGTFIWYFQDEPDTMYVFKGGSKKYSSGPIVEERPLFFYECSTTKGIYFSSLEEPLVMISGDKTKVKNLTLNKVYKIKSGKSIEEGIVVIERSDQNLKPVTTSNTHARYSTASDSYYEEHYGHSRFHDDGGCGVGYGCGPYSNKFNETNKQLAGTTPPKIIGGSTSSSNVSSNNTNSFKTTMFDSPFFNEVYYQARKLVYRFEGLYYGFEGKVLHGKFYINKETNEYYQYESISPLILVDLQKNPTKYSQAAFYDGFLLKDVSTFLVVKSQLEGLKNYRESKRPDFFSLYSSTVVPGIRKEDGIQKYYFSGCLANFKVENPPFSENKKYDYVHGRLVSVAVPIRFPLKQIQPKKDFLLGTLVTPESSSAIVPKKLITDIEEIKKEAARLNLPDVRKGTTDDILTALIKNELEETKNKNLDSEITETLEDDLTLEDAYVALSGEEEIVELLNEVFAKAEEQKDLVESLVKKGMITDTDLLSSNILVWIKDTIIQSMIPVASSNKNENDYYTYDEKTGILEFNSEKFLAGYDKDSTKNFEIF